MRVKTKRIFPEGGKMKRLIMMLLGFVIMLGAYVSCGRVEVKAGTGDDSYDQATELKANESMTDSLNSKEDINWYKFIVPDSVGVEQLTFQSTDIDARWSFEILLYIEENGFPTSCIADSGDSLSAPMSYKTIEFSYPKGTVLYAKVVRGYWLGDSPEGIDYKITFKTSAEPVKDCEWAIEDIIDSSENADTLSGGKKRCGILNSKSDVDWFKYTVKSEDPFKFIFKNTNLEASYCFQVTVFEEENGIPNKQIAASSNWMSAPISYTTDDFSFPKGTILYIKIERGHWQGEDPSGMRYIIWVEDNVGDSSSSGNTEKISKVDIPYSILAGTNVVVGKTEAGATVYVKQGKKTYSATADANGIYRIKTGKLSKGKSVKMWQKVGKSTSKKVTVKIVANY